VPADGEQTQVNGSVTDKSLADLVTRISEDASTLVREEIELAKAEVELKVRRLAQGAVVGVAAGFFAFLALIFLFDGLAWGISDLLNNPYGWAGYLIVGVGLLVLGAIAGFIASRAFKAGAPPTPEQAIEEAKRIRETLGHPEAEAAAAKAEPQP
jgi:uncharacterized membrane protein YqjE